MTSSIDPARRAFLRGGRRFRKTQPVRLPWALPEPAFSHGCTRCQQCVPACPEGIIGLDGDGIPMVDFRRGECTFCRRCAESCPEPLFVNPAENRPWQHIAKIDRSCLGNQGIFCQSCKESCETGAIGFALWERRIPTPRITPDACTGCGACVTVCPVHAITVTTESRAAETTP